MASSKCHSGSSNEHTDQSFIRDFITFIGEKTLLLIFKMGRAFNMKLENILHDNGHTALLTIKYYS